MLEQSGAVPCAAAAAACRCCSCKRRAAPALASPEATVRSNAKFSSCIDGKTVRLSHSGAATAPATGAQGSPNVPSIATTAIASAPRRVHAATVAAAASAAAARPPLSYARLAKRRRPRSKRSQQRASAWCCLFSACSRGAQNTRFVSSINPCNTNGGGKGNRIRGKSRKNDKCRATDTGEAFEEALSQSYGGSLSVACPGYC